MLDIFVDENSTINLVEVYMVCGPKKEFGYTMGYVTQNSKLMTSLQDAYGIPTKQVLCEYIHRDMIYVFDRADDRQRATRKIASKEWEQLPFYIVGYQEEQLPVHRFPSVSEITSQRIIQRTQFRVSNRIYVYIDYDESKQYSYTIRYQHASNVDVKKMDQDVERVMRIFKRCV